MPPDLGLSGAALPRRIAHVPGDVALWPELTGGEVIDPDPLMEQLFRDLVVAERGSGRTALLSSHNPVRGRGTLRR